MNKFFFFENNIKIILAKLREEKSIIRDLFIDLHI